MVLVACAAGIVPLVPPAVPADAAAGGFSVERARRHIARIAREPRPVGTPANESVRDYLVAELRRVGLEPELQAVEAPDYYEGAGRRVSVVNVLARIPGTGSTGAVALVGHYDTVPTSPGANDDASAVAVLLESARVLRAGPPLRNDVVLLFTDGEEPEPRFGSSAFVAEHPWAGDLGVVVNLEAVGGTGPSLVTQVSGRTGWIVEQFARAAPHPLVFSFVTTTAELVGSGTDLAPFRDAGVPGLELAYLHGSPIYHTPRDTPSRVGARSLHQQGANALAVTRHLAGLDLAAPRSESDDVFFPLGRSMVVRYPASWALPLALAVGLLVAAGWRRHGTRNEGRVAAGPAVLVLSLLLTTAVATAVWVTAASLHSSIGVAASYAVLAFLVVLAVAVGSAVARRLGPPSAVVVVAAWWLLALATSAAAPGLSSVFAWPALAGALALAIAAGAAPATRLARLAMVAVPSIVLAVPAIDVFFQLAQPRPGNPDSQALWLVIVPVALLGLTVELMRAFWPIPPVPPGDRSS